MKEEKSETDVGLANSSEKSESTVNQVVKEEILNAEFEKLEIDDEEEQLSLPEKIKNPENPENPETPVVATSPEHTMSPMEAPKSTIPDVVNTIEDIYDFDTISGILYNK